MPTFTEGRLSLYYEEYGEGFPILLLAPGGLRSSIQCWHRPPWNPIEVLAPCFRVIAMDQRNAGRSTAPVGADDNWHTYSADQLALLDFLGIDDCHLLGGCIGGPFSLGLMQAAPGRIRAAVLQQPIGTDGHNRESFYRMFDEWAVTLPQSETTVPPGDLEQFRTNLFDGNFVFSVSAHFVANCTVPMLVLMGNDERHPASVSREIAELAPNAELIEQWREEPDKRNAIERITEFFQHYAP